MHEALRDEVCRMNIEIARLGLAAWTSGNVSGRDPASGLVVIKPSGVLYADLRPDTLVVVDLEGRVVQGDLRPSVDTATHLAIYRSRPDVGGVAHTHSPYATSFAALGQSIPACLTTLAMEFGGDVPVGAYVPIGGEAIGREVLRVAGRSPAVLMRVHGVFTCGATATAALKAAAMLEEAALTVHLALLRGQPETLPPEEVERCYRYYHESYGQQTPASLPEV
ncbi:MAG: class II aldolase/adducin family protein [Anaerolineales bacterium]|nr:class II aldolase/adducin family protein [Anaerolineales bacterium]